MSNQSFTLLNTDLNRLELRIIENGVFHGDKSWMFNDVVSSFSRLYFIRSGNAYIERDGHRCPLLPGRMYLIPAGSRYNYVCTSQIEKFYIHFELELLPGVDLFNGLRDYLDAPSPDGCPDSLISLAQNGSLSSLLRLKSIFLDIISGFLEQAVKEKEYGIDYAGFYKQHETLAYITAHLNAGLRVSQISQALGIPRHILSRGFRQDTGIGLKDYMEQLLLQEVKKRLLTTKQPLCSIAEELDFCDAYYLSRFFRKFEQVSPREYRQRRTGQE